VAQPRLSEGQLTQGQRGLVTATFQFAGQRRQPHHMAEIGTYFPGQQDS